MSRWFLCSAGRAMKTIKKINPAMARTRTTSMIVKPAACEELNCLPFRVGKARPSGFERRS